MPGAVQTHGRSRSNSLQLMLDLEKKMVVSNFFLNSHFWPEYSYSRFLIQIRSIERRLQRTTPSHLLNLAPSLRVRLLNLAALSWCQRMARKHLRPFETMALCRHRCFITYLLLSQPSHQLSPNESW